MMRSLGQQPIVQRQFDSQCVYWSQSSRGASCCCSSRLAKPSRQKMASVHRTADYDYLRLRENHISTLYACVAQRLWIWIQHGLVVFIARIHLYFMECVYPQSMEKKVLFPRLFRLCIVHTITAHGDINRFGFVQKQGGRRKERKKKSGKGRCLGWIR